jgi:hypothetical protein
MTTALVSPLAAKINYLMDLAKAPALQYGRLKAIGSATNSKESSVTGWMFYGKIPRESKRLEIADRLGVSYAYLFNDSIAKENVTKPEISHVDGVYSIPFIEEDRISLFKQSVCFPISHREKFFLPNIDNIVSKFGLGLFLTSLGMSSIVTNIKESSGLLLSPMAQPENYCLVLYKNKTEESFSIRRIILKNSKMYVERYSEFKGLECTLVEKHDDFFVIALTYSSS